MLLHQRLVVALTYLQTPLPCRQGDAQHLVGDMSDTHTSLQWTCGRHLASAPQLGSVTAIPVSPGKSAKFAIGPRLYGDWLAIGEPVRTRGCPSVAFAHGAAGVAAAGTAAGAGAGAAAAAAAAASACEMGRSYQVCSAIGPAVVAIGARKAGDWRVSGKSNLG